jgi:hypothetical protein
VRPSRFSSGVFDRLLGVAILVLRGAQILRTGAMFRPKNSEVLAAV